MIVVMDKSQQIFLGQITKHKILTAAQERDLIRAGQAGSSRAYQLLCEHNQKIVMLVANKFRGNGLELDEMIKEGSVGLLMAARRFDLSSRYRFTSYAVWWIRARIFRAIDEQARMLRINPYQARALSKLRSMPVEQILGGDYHHPDEAIDPKLGAKGMPAYMREALAASNPASMDAPVTGEGGGAYSNFIPSQDPSPEDWTAKGQREAIAGRLLHTLEPRDRRIVSLIFGLDSGEAMTLEQVGDLMGISKERVRQIRNGAMRQLRQRAGKYGR